jgi:hypothetical protein
LSNTHFTFYAVTAPQAGMGKGRQIAGLVYDNYLKKRCRAVWFSASPDLAADAARDLSDIGASGIPINKMDDLKGKRATDGLLFCTYTTLAHTSKQGSSRLDDVVKWCKQEGGDSFEGLLCFDECHKGKGICKKEENSTKTALAILKIQRALPSARVVYISATGASELDHLGYMLRLGLWGAKTPFKDMNDFTTSVGSRGVGAMELVAMDLKARGMLLARSLSYRGAEFEIEYPDLADEYKTMYNTAVALWQGLHDVVKQLIDANAIPKKDLAQYWSSHLQFFRQLCVGAKIPALVGITKKAVHKGLCVVIGIQSTGEARLAEHLETHKLGTKLVSTAYCFTQHVIDGLRTKAVAAGLLEPNSEEEGLPQPSYFAKMLNKLQVDLDELEPDLPRNSYGARGRVCSCMMFALVYYQLARRMG